MSGGLFGKPFALNIKCIIFSLLIMGLFLYKPVIKSTLALYSILFLIFVISYVAMAWYDYYYDCRILPLKRGDRSVTGLFKPPPHSPKQFALSSDVKFNNIIIYASHILFIVPLLIYMAVYKKKVNAMVYPIIGVLAIFTLLYHGVKAMELTHK